jgi:type II secretory pathway component PulF
MRWVINKIQEEVEAGRSLSVSMRETASFSDEVIAVVEAGEASGEMSNALYLLAKNLDARGEGLKNIKNKLIYPAFSLAAAMGLGIFMITYILPGMAIGFQKANLPAVTRLALGMGLFIKSWGLALIVLAIGCCVVVAALYIRYEELIMIQLIKVPILKKLIRGSIYSSFFINLGLLLDNGVDMLKAIRVLGRSTEGKLYQRSAHNYQEALQMGRDLVHAVDQDPFLGREAAAYLRQGMATSQLGWASSRLGQHYQKEMESVLTRLTAFAEPIALAVAGGIIAILILVVLRPMMNMSTGMRF